jgi:tetratricopeptide (TPR) repeat protein
MKLQELFKSADFDKMFEYIVKFDHKMADSRFGFLVAYDMLCNMKLDGDYEKLEIVPNPYKDDEGENQEFYAWCSELEGCRWENVIGCEVVYSPELPAIPPRDMIAGICLWHLTFYGFSPEERDNHFEDIYEDDSSENKEPEYVEDIISEETKRLRPNPAGEEDEYDKLWPIYHDTYMKELETLVNQGDKYGQYFLGHEFMHGYGGTKIDLKRALSLISASASQGFLKAQIVLAYCYEKGIGTDVDFDKAREQYKLAAKSTNGRGVPEEYLAFLEARVENYDEALHWFKEAQLKGNKNVNPYILYLEKKYRD